MSIQFSKNKIDVPWMTTEIKNIIKKKTEAIQKSQKKAKVGLLGLN